MVSSVFFYGAEYIESMAKLKDFLVYLSIFLNDFIGGFL